MVIQTHSMSLGIHWPLDNKAPVMWRSVRSDVQPIIYVWQIQSPAQWLFLMLTTVFCIFRLKKWCFCSLWSCCFWWWWCLLKSVALNLSPRHSWTCLIKEIFLLNEIISAVGKELFSFQHLRSSSLEYISNILNGLSGIFYSLSL